MRGDLLTREELARKLRVSPRTINRYWAQRILPRTRLGGLVGTRPADFEKAMEKRTQKAL